MEKRNNCFTFLRLLIALSVVYQHGQVSGLNLVNIKYLNWIDKVPLFFFISAYSIMLSLDNKKISFKDYSLRRFLRLYPELWLCILLETIVLVLQKPTLLANIQFYLWIFAQITLFQFWTPDCLRDYGNGTPNGSLWTNVVFVQFYLVIYFSYKRIKKLNLFQDIFVLVLLIGVNTALSLLEGNINTIAFKLILQTVLPYLYMFYFGIIFYKYSDKLIPLAKKYFWSILILFILASEFNYITNFIPHTSNTGTVIHVLMCCVFFFAFAYKFPNIKLKNDYSYGIYIYHMVVMNFFIHNKLIKNDYVTILVVYIITIVLSIVSNKIIKKIKFVR